MACLLPEKSISHYSIVNSTRLLCTEFDFLGLFVLKGGVLIAHAICNGQTTHHGVAFISKLPAKDCVTDPPSDSAVGSDKYAYKLGWLIKIKEFVRDELVRYPRFSRVPKVRVHATVVSLVHEIHKKHENIQ